MLRAKLAFGDVYGHVHHTCYARATSDERLM